MLFEEVELRFDEKDSSIQDTVIPGRLDRCHRIQGAQASPKLGGKFGWAREALLAPYPSEEMTCWPVSTRVGNVKNSDPSLIEPIAVTDRRTSRRRLRGTIVA